jgi:hypothetical protein
LGKAATPSSTIDSKDQMVKIYEKGEDYFFNRILFI